MSRVVCLALAVAAPFALPGCTSNAPILPRTPGAGISAAPVGAESFLWRAAIETLNFATIVLADPPSGQLQTGWYVSPSNPNERMQVTVSIFEWSTQPNAFRVLAVREVNQNGSWVRAPVSAATVQKLEEIILTRARDLSRAARIG
jgi:hypothetical protein